MPEETIMTLHPQGKQGVNISKAKYDQVREVILRVIESEQPISFTYMAELSKEILTDEKFDGKPLWYITTVKLDLEARKLVVRIPKTSPHELKLT
ncbi:MAG: hypothetical protein HEP71_03065 [Roseivirga sp.]|nr:hypothetical protein [Roseivirga sp.]